MTHIEIAILALAVGLAATLAAFVLHVLKEPQDAHGEKRDRKFL